MADKQRKDKLNKECEAAGRSQKNEKSKEQDTKDIQREVKEPIDINAYPVDDKGNHIVPDEILAERHREFPDGTVNESRSYKVYRGGLLKILGGGDIKRDLEIRRMGREAQSASYRHRKDIADIYDVMLAKPAEKALNAIADDQMREKLQSVLPAGATVYDLISARMAIEAIASGDTKAAAFVRDSAGDKPVDQQEINANVITDADRELMRKIQQRMDGEQK